jgi:hypothetical protein
VDSGTRLVAEARQTMAGVSARNGAVVVLGVGFLGVALLDFLHTMS